MTIWTLVRRSLRFHARAHLGVVLGAVIGSAALVGALVVGDSVRGSLHEMALARLGRVDVALSGGDRFFRDELSLSADTAQSVPVLQVSGTAVLPDGSARANRVQVLGIDGRLNHLQPSAPALSGEAVDEVVLNSALAAHLQAKTGETILLRVQKPSALSREAPISSQQDFSVAFRVTVRGVASDEQFGRFDLNAGQVPPFNAFVPMKLLQEKLELTNRANLLLARGISSENAQSLLRQRWQLADAELELRQLPASLELRSKRVFIDPPIVDAAKAISTNSSGILTYFVNELRVGNKTTPYSMVTGTGAPLLPPEMHDDEAVINQWLADDLQAKVGDSLQLTYFILGTTRRLEEKQNSFRIRAIVPIEGPYADRELMPDFPGLAKAESTENWDAGFPIQMSKIRAKDEKYWKDYRGNPKAFVTLTAAQQMWANRFGNLTAIRFPHFNRTTNELAAALMRALDPAQLGLGFQPVRAQALAASSEAQDFGQLFLGFSFFLILAALILMGLLFQFELEQRTAEVGTLLALGFRPKQVRWIFLVEAGALALFGGIIGAIAGMAYAKAMLLGLTTIWSKAVGSAALRYHAELQTLVIGTFASFIVALITIGLVLRRQARRPARELLVEQSGTETISTARRSKKSVWLAVGCTVAAAALIAMSIAHGDTTNPEGFFSAGVLLLIGGLALGAIFLTWLANSAAAEQLTLAGMGLRGSTRRRKRSLATVALLACGSFMIVAVGANRLDANRNAFDRAAGTGGFALIGESSLPIVQDLNSPEGRQFFGLNADDLQGVSVVPMRLREGDDASCLNLNRAQTPRLLGVAPELLQQRNAFSFSRVAAGFNEKDGWSLLSTRGSSDPVPAIGDYNSIRWALHKNIGDTLDYVDERGHTFKIKLVGAVANSILQGNLLISEEQFLNHFPGAGGYRMFLIDAPSNGVTQVAATLTRGLQNAGLELTPAAARLDAFNAVQNTYLNTFQVLGGLGLLVGSAGLGVVVLRNVLERRGELALLQAVGFRKRSLRWLVLSEHAGLLSIGLGVGLIAALCAVIPNFAAASARLPLISLALTIGGVFITGLIWTWLAVTLAVRGRLLQALRNE